MTAPEPLQSTLPTLDGTEDPRGGAVTWALLVVGVVLDCRHRASSEEVGG